MKIKKGSDTPEDVKVPNDMMVCVLHYYSNKGCFEGMY